MRPTTDLGAEREAARHRHPSVRRPIDLDLMRRREVERLAAAGHPCPGDAATLIATRGRMGLDQRQLADLLGVPLLTIAGIEDGTGVEDGTGIEDGDAP